MEDVLAKVIAGLDAGDFTQAQLVEASGVNKSVVSLLKNKKRKNVRSDTLAKLSVGLDVLREPAVKRGKGPGGGAPAQDAAPRPRARRARRPANQLPGEGRP